MTLKVYLLLGWKKGSWRKMEEERERVLDWTFYQLDEAERYPW